MSPSILVRLPPVFIEHATRRWDSERVDRDWWIAAMSAER